MASKTIFPRSLNPFESARLRRSLLDGSHRLHPAVVLRIARACLAGLAEGIRLGRGAPPLGDVGTRGSDLTRWITEWNGRE